MMDVTTLDNKPLMAPEFFKIKPTGYNNKSTVYKVFETGPYPKL